MPVEKKWAVASGVKNGMPAIIRIRENVDAETRRKFSGFVLFTWHYDGRASGMPSPETQMLMGDFEDKVLEVLEEDGLCEAVINHTYNGKTEFFAYVADAENFMAKIDEALKTMPQMPLEIRHYNDPEWQGYEYWLGLASGS